MKTLVIISHPDIAGSSTQQFLISSIENYSAKIRVRHLEELYPSGAIDVATEQAVIASYQRIVFQFPLYWYSSPALLKEWQDQVFDFAQINNLAGKELGLVVNTGINQREFRAGGVEQFSMDELLRPFQATAQKLKMTYLKPFLIYQFDYMTEREKRLLLAEYQMYLSNFGDQSLASRSQWVLDTLARLKNQATSEEERFHLEHVGYVLEENKEELVDLSFALQEMKELD